MKQESWHVSVLVPARNEEELLPRCLTSIVAACAYLRVSVTTDVVIAADSCTDRTLEIARQMIEHRGSVVCTQAGVVGESRAVAARHALQRYAGPLNRCWIANTDADSEVPKTWLIHQLFQAGRGIEAIAGTVAVDTFEEHDPVVRDFFRKTYVIAGDGSHPHVHGANLGVRADAYLRSGGWRSLATGEDHDLWNRLCQSGVNRISVSHISVRTSGRRKGRAPHGFAETLAAHNGTTT